MMRWALRRIGVGLVLVWLVATVTFAPESRKMLPSGSAPNVGYSGTGIAPAAMLPQNA